MSSAVPYLLATAIIYAAYWLLIHRRRRRIALRYARWETNLCRECGYDLRAGHDRCPECGCKVYGPPLRTRGVELDVIRLGYDWPAATIRAVPPEPGAPMVQLFDSPDRESVARLIEQLIARGVWAVMDSFHRVYVPATDADRAAAILRQFQRTPGTDALPPSVDPDRYGDCGMRMEAQNPSGP